MQFWHTPHLAVSERFRLLAGAGLVLQRRLAEGVRRVLSVDLTFP